VSITQPDCASTAPQGGDFKDTKPAILPLGDTNEKVSMPDVAGTPQSPPHPELDSDGETCNLKYNQSERYLGNVFKTDSTPDLDANIPALAKFPIMPPDVAVEEVAAVGASHLKQEARVKSHILDSWEDVGAVVTSDPSFNGISPRGKTISRVRRTYTKAKLLDLRLQRSTNAPRDLPSFVVERSAAGDFRAVRRLGPGGPTRGGGAGAGGGGSSSSSATHRYSAASMEDPRRDHYSSRHGTGGRQRKTEHTAAAEKWDRGHRVKQKEGSREHWGPDPVEPLKTSAHRWDRKREAANDFEVSLNKLTSILNKMTPQNFEKLSNQLCCLEMTSSEMLRSVIGVIFDKAVDEPHFAVIYAALCVRLAEATRVWPFIRVVKDESSGSWSWVADLEVDTSKLHPLPNMASVELLLDSSDVAHAEIGVGQLQLQPSDCFLKSSRLVCCYFADQRPGIVFAVIQDAKATLFGMGTSKLFGKFATKEEAEQDAMKKASFKRLLLNQCQEEFERNVRSCGGAAALEAAARDAKAKAKHDAIEAARLAAEHGTTPKEAPDELELEFWAMKLKRRMLGNVKFIGELFKQHLLKEKIMHECIKLLLGSLDDPDVVPDDESIEAAAKLFLTIGKQLESPASSKAKLDAYCKRLSVLSKDKKKLAARTRFMLQDLLECRRNGWKERRAKDGPHKLAAKQPVISQPTKSETQHRRDQERNMARERQRQAVSRIPAPSGSQSGSSQDVRQLRHSPASTLRILARDQELTKCSTVASEQTIVKLWTDDRTTNRARSSLDEFAHLSDAEELIASLDEVPSDNKVYKRTFELTVSRIIEGRDSERNASLEAVRTLAAKTRLRTEDVTEVLADTLEFLPDVNIDSPKAIAHVARLLALILELKVIDFSWLTRDSGRIIGDPQKEKVPERKALFEHLAAYISEHAHAATFASQIEELLLSLD